MIQNVIHSSQGGRIVLSFLSMMALGGCTRPQPVVEPEPPAPVSPVADDALIKAMKTTFGSETALIQHTLDVYRFALDIQEHEGGDLFVVKAAALFHDIGIPRARKLHGERATDYYEVEGPPVTREVFAGFDVPRLKMNLICGIIENHHSAGVEAIVNTLEFRIIWDADWLSNLGQMQTASQREEVEQAIDSIFRTNRGKELARAHFID